MVVIYIYLQEALHKIFAFLNYYETFFYHGFKKTETKIRRLFSLGKQNTEIKKGVFLSRLTINRDKKGVFLVSVYSKPR